MKTLLIYSSLILTVGLPVSAVTPPSSGPLKADIASQVVSSESDVLQRTYDILSHAGPGYHGHRLRALKRVRLAGALLGLEFDGERTGTENPEESDASLRVAAGLLTQLRNGLPADAEPKMQDHLDHALAQINAALNVHGDQNDDSDGPTDGEKIGPTVVASQKNTSANPLAMPVDRSELIPSLGSTITTTGSTALTSAQQVLRPTVRLMKQSDGTLALTWNALPNQQFQVQSSSDLTGNNWQNVGGPFTATDISVTLPVTTGENTRRFYRVLLLQ